MQRELGEVVSARHRSEELRQKMAEMGRSNLYYLAKIILGYNKLVPSVHGPMCRFWDLTRRENRRMMLMPRLHYKTTLWSIAGTIQDIVRNPNVRVLMVSDTASNAQNFMREVQLHFELNEVFRWVYSEIIPDTSRVVWNSERMEVNRTIISSTPTVSAIGAFGGIESRHFDVIRADDLVTERYIHSEVEMDKLIKWVGGLEPLLSNIHDGRIDFIGSRKKKGDMYEHVMNSYLGDKRPEEIGPFTYRYGGLVVFSRGAEDEQGNPIFPQVISKEFLQRLRRTDPERYFAQMANSPRGSGLNFFEPEWLRYWQWGPDGKIHCIHRGETLLVASPWEMERFVLYDPAVAEKKSSSMQAIVVMAKGSGPFRIVLETRIGHFDPSTAMDYLYEIAGRWNPSFFSIERRGFQGWVKYALDERAETRGLPYLPIVEWPPQGSPSARWAKVEHIRALQPMVRSGYLWIHEEQKELRDELEFYPNVRWDDGLDALAQSLTYAPLVEGEQEKVKREKAEREFLDRFVLGLQDIESGSSYKGIEYYLERLNAGGYSLRRGNVLVQA